MMDWYWIRAPYPRASLSLTRAICSVSVWNVHARLVLGLSRCCSYQKDCDVKTNKQSDYQTKLIKMHALS